MATGPDEYRMKAGFRRSSASDAAGPTAAGSPTEDDAPPSIGRMISTDGQATFIPEVWLKAIKANDDSILAKEGGQGLDLYVALLDDDVVFSAIQQRFLAVTSRDWEVTPGDDKDPRSVKAADDFRAMLNGFGFDRVTKGLLWSVYFGYGVGEAMWSIRQHEGRPIVWLDDVVIPDRRHFGFTMEGELRLTATLDGGMSGQELPDNKFIAVRTGGTHDFAFYGLGLAHWLYWPIFFKRSALKFWALYLEKFGMPTVGIEYPASEANDKKAKADRLSAAVAVGQDRAVLLPEGTLSNNQLKLIEAERSGAGASSYKDFVTIQDDATIRVILGQTGTSKAQPGGLGGDGQAKKDEGVKREIVKADADIISEAIYNLARWVTAWNHGPDVAPPKTYRLLDDEEDLNTTAERDVKLNGIGIKRTEESVRQVYGEGYEVDRLSEQDKAAQARETAALKLGAVGAAAGKPANDNTAKIAAKRTEFGVDDVAPLYVYRSANAKTRKALAAYCASIGLPMVPGADLHATVLYSKTPVDWFSLGESWQPEVSISKGGPRKLERLGDGSAIVLRFENSDMRYRHESMIERGASHDYPEFLLHMTLSYDAPEGFDPATVEPYVGELEFGPEMFERIEVKEPAFDAATFDFAAADEEAIDRLVRSLVDEANPIFSAMVEEMKSGLQGVTTAEGARVALLEAWERFPIERLARLTALPMLAERAGALVGAEELVDG